MEIVEIGLIVAGVMASFVILMAFFMLCSWCFGSKKSVDQEENETIESTDYNPIIVLDTDETDVHQLQSRHWEDRARNNQGFGAGSPVVTRKTIQFERPERQVVTETVQPRPSSNTALNNSFGLRRDLQYQAMSPHRPLESSPSQRSALYEKSSSSNHSDEGRDLWKGVRNFAANFLEEPPVENAVSQPIVEGIDYHLGKIQVALSYDFQTLTLTLKVLQATGLPAKDFTGTSDPYVKILLLPDKKHKLLTKVKKKNLNPRWNECFLFEGWPHNKLLEKTLYLQVIDYDRFSRDDPIGEIYIPLNEVDLSQSPLMWKFLSPCKDSRGKLGELLLSLSYEPHVGRLTVIVMKAKDLKAKDITGASDPYVKIWLMYGKEKVEKKKTTIKMRNLNPVFNESFIFEIPWDKIREACLEVTVMDFDKVGRNEMIGKILLGSRSGPLETRHWSDMISKPRQQVAQWHLLKD